jgi:hypothetical protein
MACVIYLALVVGVISSKSTLVAGTFPATILAGAQYSFEVQARDAAGLALSTWQGLQNNALAVS